MTSFAPLFECNSFFFGGGGIHTFGLVAISLFKAFSKFITVLYLHSLFQSQVDSSGTYCSFITETNISVYHRKFRIQNPHILNKQ